MEIDYEIYFSFIFSFVPVFNHEVFIYIDIARIGTSNACSWWRHKL